MEPKNIEDYLFPFAFYHKAELIYRSLTRRWSFIIFPKSFQNLSQNCKFLFCLYFSVSHKSQIKNARSYFLTFMFLIWITWKEPKINTIFVLNCCWYITLHIQKNKEKQKNVNFWLFSSNSNQKHKSQEITLRIFDFWFLRHRKMKTADFCSLVKGFGNF